MSGFLLKNKSMLIPYNDITPLKLTKKSQVFENMILMYV